jgi:electron transport complex protein RnfD
MYTVIATLLPVVVVSVLLFGMNVLLLYAVSIATAVVTEAVVKKIRGQSPKSVYDGSAVITGLLLVMVVPPGLSPIFVALGAFVAIFIGKEVFGGLGANIFNPALVGRAFLSASYPVQMTTYSKPAALFPFIGGADAASGATPLAAARFEGVIAPLKALFFGQTGGSIGETCALLIILGGLVLIALKIVDWRLVLSYLGTVFLLGGLFHLIDPGSYPPALFHLLSGGLALGAFYMATDMATSPYTPWGSVVFGVGAGIIVVVIRLFGGFPEGVMYSILLMNAATPLINRYTLPKTFGEQTGKGAVT